MIVPQPRPCHTPDQMYRWSKQSVRYRNSIASPPSATMALFTMPVEALKNMCTMEHTTTVEMKCGM